MNKQDIMCVFALRTISRLGVALAFLKANPSVGDFSLELVENAYEDALNFFTAMVTNQPLKDKCYCSQCFDSVIKR